MNQSIPVAGSADPRFKSVRDAFTNNLVEGEDLGACFAVFIDGECVIDLRGGWCDKAKQEPWTEDTLACVYSSGKAALALLIARAVSAGEIDYNAPVAQYWPEFAAAGKERITVAEALSHQAGLCGVSDEMAPEDWLEWEKICAKIAAMAPLWPPGSASGYHPQTFGFIAGAILRRATGRGVGQTLREDFSRPYGLNIYCGLDMDTAARAAYMKKPPAAPDLGTLTDLKRIAFLKPWSAPAKVSREAWAAAELPASNIHADAKALAEIVQPFANDGRFRGDAMLDDSARTSALDERIRGADLVLPFTLSWSAGVMRNIAGHFGPSKTAYGHAGFGGSTVMFDPARKLSAAYVMNKMSPYLVGDPRGVRLIEATYDAL